MFKVSYPLYDHAQIYAHTASCYYYYHYYKLMRKNARELDRVKTLPPLSVSSRESYFLSDSLAQARERRHKSKGDARGFTYCSSLACLLETRNR